MIRGARRPGAAKTAADPAGTHLLVLGALRKAVAAGDVAAARLIVVDAVDDDAAAFYERYGFVRAPENPHRLYRRMKDVRASLDSSADG